MSSLPKFKLSAQTIPPGSQMNTICFVWCYHGQFQFMVQVIGLVCSSNVKILASLHWLPVKFRIDFKIAVYVYKALAGPCTKIYQ